MFCKRASFVATFLRHVGAMACVSLIVGAPSLASPSIQHSVQADTGRSVPTRAQVLLVRGMTEASLNDHTEAIKYFESALEQAPEAPVLLQALADAHSAKGNPTTALYYARRAHKYGRERAHHHHRLAELQQQAGSPEAALRTYRKLLDRFPENTEAYEARAQLQADLDRPRAALKTYDALLERLSDPPAEVYRERLSLYRQIGDSSGVRETLKSLVKARPSSAPYRRQLARLYTDAGEYGAALDLLRPLIAAFPNDPDLRSRVETLSEKTGRTDVSVPSETGKTSAMANGASPVARAESIYAEATPISSSADTARLREAEDLLRQSLEQSPKAVDALTLLARIHEHRGEHAQAGTVLERALEQNPRAPDRWVRAASAYRTAGRFEKAASVAEEGLLLFPGQHSLIRTAAVAHLRLQRPRQALTHYQNALDLKSDGSMDKSEAALLWAGLGVARARLDRPEKAHAAFEKARSVGPADPTAQLLERYGDVQQALGNETKARQYWQKALDRAPDRDSLRRKLGQDSK